MGRQMSLTPTSPVASQMGHRIEDSLHAPESRDGDASIQAPTDHEAGDGGWYSRNVDTLSVRRGRTGRRKADVSERSCPARDGRDRQPWIICGMDRTMTAARTHAGEVSLACSGLPMTSICSTR